MQRRRVVGVTLRRREVGVQKAVARAVVRRGRSPLPFDIVYTILCLLMFVDLFRCQAEPASDSRAPWPPANQGGWLLSWSHRSHLPASPSPSPSPSFGAQQPGTHSRPCPEMNQGRAWSRRTWIARAAFAIEVLARCGDATSSTCACVSEWCVARSGGLHSLFGHGVDLAWTGYVLLLRTVAGGHSWPQNSSYCVTVYRLAIAALAFWLGCPNRWDAADGEIGCKAATRQGQK